MLPRYSDYDRAPQRPPASDSDAPARGRIRVGVLAGAFVGLAGLVVVGVLVNRPPTRAPSVPDAAVPPPGYEIDLPKGMPPPARIDDPVIQPAARAGLADDDPVVGVCLEG